MKGLSIVNSQLAIGKDSRKRRGNEGKNQGNKKQKGNIVVITNNLKKQKETGNRKQQIHHSPLTKK